MDRRVIEEKLESLRHCLSRIREKRPDSPDKFLKDFDLQDIVTLNLTRAVQLCVDVAAHLISAADFRPPDSMSETFDVMAQNGIIDRALAERMQRAVGFRNIAVHNYRSIDWTIVHTICQKHLGDFDGFARSVVKYLQQH